MIEEKFENEFETVYSIICEFKRNKYKEIIGSVNFCDFEISLNELTISLLRNSLNTNSIGKKAADFYIFEIGLKNAVLIEQRRAYLERNLIEGEIFAPQFSAVKNNAIAKK